MGERHVDAASHQRQPVTQTVTEPGLSTDGQSAEPYDVGSLRFYSPTHLPALWVQEDLEPAMLLDMPRQVFPWLAKVPCSSFRASFRDA
jgi:hypothetical protein